MMPAWLEPRAPRFDGEVRTIIRPIDWNDPEDVKHYNRLYAPRRLQSRRAWEEANRERRRAYWREHYKRQKAEGKR